MDLFQQFIKPIDPNSDGPRYLQSNSTDPIFDWNIQQIHKKLKCEIVAVQPQRVQIVKALLSKQVKFDIEVPKSNLKKKAKFEYESDDEDLENEETGLQEIDSQ